MPVIIGWYIGKMIGTLIVAIITLSIRLLRMAVNGALRVIKHAFLGLDWLTARLCDGAEGLYVNYKLNHK